MRPITHWVEQHALRRPDAEALVDLGSGTRVSYGVLWNRIRSVAHALQRDCQVAVGDRVAILSRNDSRVIEAMYACALLGAIAVPLNWRLAPTELAQVCRDAEPRVILAEDAQASVCAQVRALDPHLPPVVSWSSNRVARDGYDLMADAGVPDGWAPTDVDEEAVWTIIYTSGTTGRPKGVQTTHRAALASMLGILVAHGISADSRGLTVLPTFHVAGLNLFTNPILFAGGSVLLARAFDSVQALHLLREAEPAVTHFCGVPANYQFIERLTEFESRPLRPFVAVVGGSPVPPSLLASWRERGVPLSAVFGITEAGACVTAVPPAADPGVSGAVGLPVLHARCRVQDVNGSDLDLGQIGELQISGDVVSVGYWRNQEATESAFTRDGWLRTGDAAAIREDGQVVLVDRWKDMYISGGENVYPAEVENVLTDHPGVAQAAVVGVPDPKWGETGVAFVMAAADAVLEEAEVRAFCLERLARFKVPGRVVVVQDFPRNATGKTLKGELRTRLSDRVD
ncbi:class I adenylate-forming enzyme family protein [Nocardioides sp. LS1]|uniref:class I adenylate-forming enzyme family protein n=1 Tax=Nocardioides sp. LS1 TaxID=1027620 RepID=UPI000F627E54|nr:AMP-binding protein [Nocardioides sp. LS1]GCD88623.1 acid--CoA ligase [Nocardioides sp. LS1]